MHQNKMHLKVAQRFLESQRIYYWGASESMVIKPGFKVPAWRSRNYWEGQILYMPEVVVQGTVTVLGEA